jgi:site-specific DNA-methyltransferase (adenine-specific)
MIKPYYEENGITIYHGDCRDILPELEPVDLVLTDPPFPNMEGRVSNYKQCDLSCLETIDCRQLIFWQAIEPFPLNFNAIHIWDKKVGTQSQYERIFERNSTSKANRVFRHYLINSTVAASFTGDIYTGHYSQKPIKLINEILSMFNAKNILDPFMGSGTTLRSAKDLHKKAIGIEIEEKYCEIAVKRLAQGVLDFAS